MRNSLTNRLRKRSWGGNASDRVCPLAREGRSAGWRGRTSAQIGWRGARLPALALICCSCVIAGLGWATAARSATTDEAASAEPVITSIWLEGTNVMVLARVPAGISKVTLEGCRRLGGEAWTPKAVGRLNGAGGEMTFRLAQSPDLELLRIRADAREALPGFFYTGPSSFSGQPVSGSDFVNTAVPGAAKGAGGEIVAFDNAGAPASPGGQVQARAVTESDIWEISGDTLYFFNQYRGLQVIDIRDPVMITIHRVWP